MFQATNSRMPASAGNGTSEASGAASSTISSSVMACTMPATGVRAPARALVTLRAMVPVAGMPPNRGLTMLATPCAINSWFGSWRGRSVTLSAMRAHISDSMAPSNAIVRVGISNCLALSQLKAGRASAGKVRGISPKREPMVSTGKANHEATTVIDTRATTGPGMRVTARSALRSVWRSGWVPPANSLGHRNRPPKQARPMARACGLKLSRWLTSAPICEKKSAGILSIDRPSRSLSCDRPISTAMPFVKPMMIDTGM